MSLDIKILLDDVLIKYEKLEKDNKTYYQCIQDVFNIFMNDKLSDAEKLKFIDDLVSDFIVPF